MSLIGLFSKKDKPELRKIVETQIPGYKSEIVDHTNRTVPIMNALKMDRNQEPYNAFAKACQEDPKYAIAVSMEKAVEGSKNPTMVLIGGRSYDKEVRVLTNTIAGELNEEKVHQIQEETLSTLMAFTNEYLEAKYAQEKEPISNF